MARAVTGIDWEQIKTLYLQGFTSEEIASKTGAKAPNIRQRARRHNWTVVKAKAKEVATAIMSQSPSEESFIEKGTRWRARFAKVTDKSLQAIENLPDPQTPKEVLQYEEILPSTLTPALPTVLPPAGNRQSKASRDDGLHH